MLKDLFTQGEQIKNLKIALRKIEAELNDHLETINASTNELASVYELMADLDRKIDKLSSRIDDLQMRFEHQPIKISYQIQPLTKREKEIFLAFYTSHDDKLSYKDIAQKTGFSELMIQEYITSLIAKGVPLSKKVHNNVIYVSLDNHFKEQQTRENIIKIK